MRALLAGLLAVPLFGLVLQPAFAVGPATGQTATGPNATTATAAAPAAPSAPAVRRPVPTLNVDNNRSRMSETERQRRWDERMRRVTRSMCDRC